MYVDIGRSLSTDYFLIADQLTREQLSCRAPGRWWP